ncbi:MAG: hypothetical protein WB615_14485 [Candidatus Tumulicola sp.]
MNRISGPGLVVAGFFLAFAAGCHGAPVGSNAIPNAAGGMVPPALIPDTSPIHASCHVPITVSVGHEVICRFNEPGYDGIITIEDRLNGAAVVRPHSAKAGDPFIVRGVHPGSGAFYAHDSMHHSLKVDVTVPPEPVVSSCGHSIRIHILGILRCQFHEEGYDGNFTIDPSHLSGIATISPESGDKHTQFTVTGIVEGGGYFIVTGVRSLRVHVQVTTP